MATPGLAQLWSLDISPPKEAPLAPNLNLWLVNNILFNRVGANFTASLLAAIPRSETRLRDDGIIPLYSFLRKINNTLKSSAQERGVAMPAIPDIPEDLTEEASTDCKTLSEQFRPHVAEPVRVGMDWATRLQDQDTKSHWSSVVAACSVPSDMFIQMAPALGGMIGGSESGPFLALMTGEEMAGIVNVINEELLRFRAQSGSGWNEEEAKRLAKEHLENIKGIMAVGMS